MKSEPWRLLARLLFFTLTMFFCAAPSASPTVVIRESAEGLISLVTRQLGKEAGKEVLERFGREGVEQLLSKAAKEGGEEAVERVVRVASSHGALAVKALQRTPAITAKALDDLPSEMVKPALGALARNEQLYTRLLPRFGSEALEIEVRHPGVGAQLLEKLGPDVVRVGRTVPTDDMVRLARHADDIAQLPPNKSGQILEAFRMNSKGVLNYLEKHPRVLYTAGGVAAVIALKDNLFGQPNDTGFIDRTISNTIKELHLPLGLVLGAIGLGLFLFVFARAVRSIYRQWLNMRLDRLRFSAEKEKLKNQKR